MTTTSAHPSLPTFYGYAIGRQLAFVRANADIPVASLAIRLAVSTGELLDWESGTAAVSAAVLQEWCGLLGVTATSVLEWAQSAAPPGVRGLVVDLRAVSRWRTSAGRHPHKQLIDWARRVSAELDSPIVAVPQHEIELLALRWSTPTTRLVEMLTDLTPMELLPWDRSTWRRPERRPDRRAATTP